MKKVSNQWLQLLLYIIFRYKTNKNWICNFLKRFYLFIFRERRREGRKRGRDASMCERYIHQSGALPLACPLPGTWPTIQACVLTGSQTGDLPVCRPALNPLSHTSQGKFVIFVIKFMSKNFTFIHSLVQKIISQAFYWYNILWNANLKKIKLFLFLH